MNTPNRSSNRCGNEGCDRSPDPGEAYCFPCDLERSLYRRDSRRRTVELAQAPAEKERAIRSPASP